MSTQQNTSDLLKQSQERSAARFHEQFRQEQMAIYKANLQQAADKLGLLLNEENLPTIAREMRAMKAAKEGKK